MTAPGGLPFCCECEDQEASLLCINCDENFCGPCYESQHRRGKRSAHKTRALLGSVMANPNEGLDQSGRVEDGTGDAMATDAAEPHSVSASATAAASPPPAAAFAAGGDAPVLATRTLTSATLPFNDFKYIPMRLSAEERRLLSLMEGSLTVSEYTDNVDTFRMGGKQARMVEGLEDMCNTIAGLYVCADFRAGSDLVSRDHAGNGEFFRAAFEVARRYKIMNPSKMRSTFGKLMYMLQDSAYCARELGFEACKPISTVATFLGERDCQALLSDPLLAAATSAIDSWDSESQAVKGRELIDAEVREKAACIAYLASTYSGGSSGSGSGGASGSSGKGKAAAGGESEGMDCTGSGSSVSGGGGGGGGGGAGSAGAGAGAAEEQSPKPGGPKSTMTEEDVRRVLDSIADCSSYLSFNCTPVDKMLALLQQRAGPGAGAKGGGGQLNIAVQSGRGGACFSHDHDTHYSFVTQTLTLWRLIMQNMYRMWMLADADLLDTRSDYRLCNTGQGLNRVQQCPRVAREMNNMLAKARSSCGGGWVGLSVVHLGDRDVPNALMFIDKYTQIPRILSAVAQVVENVDELYSSDPGMKTYIDGTFGSTEKLKDTILQDYLKYGFDGSGDDGGSCIDGRLTSTWNWCSKLEKKPFYPVFMLCGFQGFDGSWKA